MFKLVALDMDGTLVELNIPFSLIREKLGIKSRPILETILEEKDEKRREEMLKVLEDFEISSAEDAKLAFYARELIDFLRKSRIIYGIVTRNSRKSVEIISKKFSLNFDFIISREDTEPKPSDKPIRILIEKYGLKNDEVLMVGDHIFDLISGKKAKVKTALIVHEKNKEMVESFKQYADYVFYSLKELAKFLGDKS